MKGNLSYERKSKLWKEIKIQDLIYERKYEAKLAWECKMESTNAWMRKLQMRVQMLQVLKSSIVTKKFYSIMVEKSMGSKMTRELSLLKINRW